MVLRCFPPDPVFSARPRVFHQTPCFPHPGTPYLVPLGPGPAFSTYPGKNSAKEKRTKAQKKVTADTKTPPNWKAFSLDNTSHKDLFSLLTSRVANFKFPEIKELNFVSDESVFESRVSTFIQKCVH